MLASSRCPNKNKTGAPVWFFLSQLQGLLATTKLAYQSTYTASSWLDPGEQEWRPLLSLQVGEVRVIFEVFTKATKWHQKELLVSLSDYLPWFRMNSQVFVRGFFLAQRSRQSFLIILALASLDGMACVGCKWSKFKSYLKAFGVQLSLATGTKFLGHDTRFTCSSSGWSSAGTIKAFCLLWRFYESSSDHVNWLLEKVPNKIMQTPRGSCDEQQRLQEPSDMAIGPSTTGSH